jgi:poly-gamma-glutamate synthesis protein (capsule biosynthesis protein)
MADMRRRLSGLGIASAGVGDDEAAAHAAAVVERGGLRVAFLGYVDVPVEGPTGFSTKSWAALEGKPGVAWADGSRIAEDVREAKKSADVVVVFLHAGIEGLRAVTPAQIRDARAAIDAGAALVLGSHPHVLQRAELYHGGLIAYSLGNFVFDGFSFPENYSAILSVSLSAAGVVGYRWLPMVVERGLPRPATDAEKTAVLALLK